MTVFRLVSADWVEKRLDSPDFLVLDPRSAVRYMAGHPKNAVNLSVAKLRDSQGNLLPNEELARRIGKAGLDAHRAPVIYDNADGRNAARICGESKKRAANEFAGNATSRGSETNRLAWRG